MRGQRKHLLQTALVSAAPQPVHVTARPPTHPHGCRYGSTGRPDWTAHMRLRAFCSLTIVPRPHLDLELELLSLADNVGRFVKAAADENGKLVKQTELLRNG